MNFEDVIAKIREKVPDVHLGNTLLKHLWATRGRGKYEPVPRDPDKPLQFEYRQHGSNTGKFIGIASHRGRKRVSFGSKHDNRE